jgi:hypothetical protein
MEKKKKEVDYSPSLSCSLSHENDYYDDEGGIRMWLNEPVFFKRYQWIIISFILLCLVYSKEIYNFIKRINISLD